MTVRISGRPGRHFWRCEHSPMDPFLTIQSKIKHLEVALLYYIKISFSLTLFKKNLYTICKKNKPIYVFINCAYMFHFLHILDIYCFYSFYIDHSREREVIFHCGFDLHFSNNKWAWTFYVPAGYLYDLFEEKKSYASILSIFLF